MTTSWEREDGRRTSYASVNGDGFVIGDHCGSGHTDSAGTCTLAELLDGRYQDQFEKRFGKAALADLLAAARSLVAKA